MSTSPLPWKAWVNRWFPYSVWSDPIEDEATPDPEIAAAAAIADGMPRLIAEAVGQFRTELDNHDAVSWDEAKRLTRDYLERLLDTWHPLPTDDE